MIIPDKIKIELIDNQGNRVPIENVLLGLKLFMSDGSWYNYSFFKTDALGEVTLSRRDIIENTELKWEKNFLSNASTKFELYVRSGNNTTDLIEAIRRILKLYEDQDAIRKDLRGSQVNEADIDMALANLQNKKFEELAFYEFIEKAVNHHIHSNPEKIEGVWKDSVPKVYRFAIEKI